MKKPLTIVLAIIAVAAIIVSCVFGSQKGTLQKTADDLTKQLEDAKAEAATTAADLTKQLEDAKAEAETKAAEAAEAAAAELEAVKAEAEAKTADLTKQLEDAKAEAEAKTADLTKQLEDAKAEAETKAAEAAEAAAAELETVKAEAEAKTADLTKQLEDAKAEAEAKAADLTKQLEDAKAEAQGQIDELTGKLAKAERALVAAQSNAYIMYANADWSVQNWGTADSEDGGVTVTPAAVAGEGDYTVALEFAQPAEGLAFTALGIKNGEIDLPFYSIVIKDIRVNGASIAVKKGYTNSDDGKETRMNIYNEWVSDLPADAHTADGSLADAAPVIVDKADFASVSKMEVDFSVVPLKAYLMFANADWSVSFWNDGNIPEGVTPILCPVTGEGDGTVGLEFAEPVEGLAFTAVGIKNGEKMIPGYIIQVTGVYLNGSEESIMTGKSYTNSDDGVETRANVYNEWVTALPDDARTADGNLEDASSMIVDPAAFTGVTSVKVTYKIIKGKPAAAPAEETMSKEEADQLKEAGFHAYIGVQGKDTYVFRNAWYDNYGLNDTEKPFFNRLTGWDEGNNAVDYGGSFEDTEIKGDGEYTVSLTTGEMGFGTTEAFNLLFVSTDIPSKLVASGYLTLSDVKTKIGEAATKDYTEIDTSGEYVLIKVIDTYNQASDPFGYTVPGADATISITFTVGGWTAE